VARVDKAVILTGALMALSGCGGGGGGGSSNLNVPEGALSPDQAVETFMLAVQEAQRSRATGELTDADLAYQRMAAVFGTESGSIRRSYSSEEVRNRMIVLAACLRPTEFRRLSSIDPEAGRKGWTLISVQINRGGELMTLPFRVVLGRGDRWFIEQIDLSNFIC
jgi:hypothetical protein